MASLIRSAVFRLTVSYLGIIMALSLTFSWILYQISTGELDRSLRQPPILIQLNGNQFDYNQFRVVRLSESREHLRANLILFNIITLILGGGISYYLARRTLEPIEEAMEAQSRFTADASHELRTPLTAMQTEIEVALRNPELDIKAAKEQLKSNLEEIAKLRMLSEGLLRLARQHGQDMAMENVQLFEVAKTAIDRFERQAKTKHIKLELSGNKSVATMADREALTEVAAILLDNAIKYSKSGKVVTLTTRKHGHHAEIEIADQGVGIKPDDIHHIFERFYRSDASRSKEQVDGYGLGLSIADKITRLHKGSIDVKSKLGKGSTFTVRLPLAQSGNQQIAEVATPDA